MVLLSVAAVLVPLLKPRPYVPMDPDVRQFLSCSLKHTHAQGQHPDANPNPEQTTSLLSKWLFAYLDKVIIEATRVEHLPIDHLPSLADDNRARYLAGIALPVGQLSYMLQILSRSLHATDP